MKGIYKLVCICLATGKVAEIDYWRNGINVLGVIKATNQTHACQLETIPDEGQLCQEDLFEPIDDDQEYAVYFTDSTILIPVEMHKACEAEGLVTIDQCVGFN